MKKFFKKLSVYLSLFDPITNEVFDIEKRSLAFSREFQKAMMYLTKDRNINIEIIRKSCELSMTDGDVRESIETMWVFMNQLTEDQKRDYTELGANMMKKENAEYEKKRIDKLMAEYVKSNEDSSPLRDLIVSAKEDVFSNMPYTISWVNYRDDKYFGNPDSEYSKESPKYKEIENVLSKEKLIPLFEQDKEIKDQEESEFDEKFFDKSIGELTWVSVKDRFPSFTKEDYLKQDSYCLLIHKNFDLGIGLYCPILQRFRRLGICFYDNEASYFDLSDYYEYKESDFYDSEEITHWFQISKGSWLSFLDLKLKWISTDERIPNYSNDQLKYGNCKIFVKTEKGIEIFYWYPPMELFSLGGSGKYHIIDNSFEWFPLDAEIIRDDN